MRVWVRLRMRAMCLPEEETFNYGEQGDEDGGGGRADVCVSGNQAGIPRLRDPTRQTAARKKNRVASLGMPEKENAERRAETERRRKNRTLKSEGCGTQPTTIR